MRHTVPLAILSLGLLASCLPCNSVAAEADPLDAARVHLQKGRYAEALAAYDALAETQADPARIAVGRSRAYEAEGKWAEATRVLDEAVKTHPRDAALHARLAEVLFRQGRYDEAEKHATEALELDSRQPRARLVFAGVQAETGRIDEAAEGYRWFVRHYNQTQPTDAETLLLVARGAVQYARWNSASQIFGFTVNTLCPDALADDELAWPAHQIAGDLFLEKYNRADGLPELKQALTINPRAAEVLVSLGNAAVDEHELEEAEEFADRALQINPQLPSALLLKADLRIGEGKLPDALKLVRQAQEVNPHDQRTLAREAACYLLTDGLPPGDQFETLLTHLDTINQVPIDDPGRFARLLAELAQRNPRPGYFLAELGEILEARRQFAAAERLYEAAIAVMPQLPEPKTALGMLAMRTGQIDRAGDILDAAFEADPYHVRVSNMRKVLKVLDDYDTIETEHFIVRFDPEKDRLLAEYLAEYLEEVYPRLTKQFGFEPPRKTQFEIYNEARGLSGHQWFSARMIGLPWIQTVGATTGMIVAFTSPNAGDDPFNWAQVARHEFVHIITLQQTDFHIPHWFTEALAVREEGYPRPELWNRLLLERVPKGKLWTLENLTDGFVRPETSHDWQFAYCQSELYADYMVEKYGEPTLAKLLDAYRENLPTERAIQRAFGVDLQTFEEGYRQYLQDLIAQLRGGTAEPEKSLAELEKAHRADPDDPQAAAAYAYQLLKLRKMQQARELAQQTLKKNKAEPLAALVMAHLELRAEDVDAAVAHLEAALDRQQPHPKLLEALAQLRLYAEDYKEAAELYELGRKTFPADPTWLKGLAAAALKLGDAARLRQVLKDLAARDPDDAAVFKKLAQMALDEKDWAEALHYGRLSLFVDVTDAEIHRILGTAYRHLQNRDKALREFRVAVELNPDDAESQQALQELEP